MQTQPGLQKPDGRRHTGRLPAGVAFYLQVSIMIFLLAGSAAPTPLYARYQAEWGFSPITVTIVFGVYALAVLAALLTIGSLSDHIGRRPVLITALVVQALTMLVFATAGGVTELLVARIVQGLSTGAAVGALGAGVLDIHHRRGTIANAVGPMTGTAVGAIGSALLVQYLPAPTHLVYLVIFGVFVIQTVGVLLMADTSVPRPGALASLRPRFGVPAQARAAFLTAVPALVAVWALGGFYLSLGPALTRLIAGSTSTVLGGLAPLAMAGSAALAVLVLRNAQPRTVLSVGIPALLVGVALTVLAMDHASTPVFFIGTAVAGVGFGAGFQGGLRTVIPLAEPHERAGMLSSLYAVSYLAMGVPAVLGGLLVVHAGLLPAAREYSIGVMLLGAAALLGSLAQNRRTQNRLTQNRPTQNRRTGVTRRGAPRRGQDGTQDAPPTNAGRSRSAA
jgi:MFS family permease